MSECCAVKSKSDMGGLVPERKREGESLKSIRTISAIFLFVLERWKNVCHCSRLLVSIRVIVCVGVGVGVC